MTNLCDELRAVRLEETGYASLCHRAADEIEKNQREMVEMSTVFRQVRDDLQADNARLRAAVVSTEKPRPCPHGKVWLIGSQTCMCSANALEPGVHLHDEGDAVSCALHVDIASDNEATVLAARKKIVDFILDSPATGEFMVTVLDAKRCPTLKSGACPCVQYCADSQQAARHPGCKGFPRHPKYDPDGYIAGHSD